MATELGVAVVVELGFGAAVAVADEMGMAMIVAVDSSVA